MDWGEDAAVDWLCGGVGMFWSGEMVSQKSNVEAVGEYGFLGGWNLL
jgi:hypothetical protein